MAEAWRFRPKNKVWKKQLWQPLPKWHRHQGSSNDCGPYCAAMAANGLRDAAVVADPDELARKMEGPPPVRGMLLPARIPNWATFPWGVAGVLRSLGFEAHWRPLAATRDLWANLNRNRVTIVIIGEPWRRRDGKYAGWSHYKLLYAWDPEEGWAFVDPAADEDVIFSYQDEASFDRQWRNMGRQIIEVEN